ncbi:DUF2235 domain-containing protein [Thiohalobacter sp. IOR34]|uniref:DUF2235 domain-containing protein n=1 Tax=Thiohalobacter sp. IOR34 TaxID=3057176 RepID=UPI0025B20BAF|nr:DUF2235 domain-containing protein [Thiohalobacter sp. IOR34]WJW75470.1 DUF2235 domain-containing protein [Thiohalobacter sp. IOR34]
MKRIAIFSDGTWNSPERGEATNVLRLARGVRPRAGDIEQVVFYDWGVGTDRRKLAGGISGAGIDKNIMDAYRFLVHNYEPGDALFFFGFSRGAYTVRSLAGFVRNCGLLRREHADRIPEAYRLYRQRSRNSSPDAQRAVAFRARYAVADITEIEFVGAWDTVGALGIPVPFWGTLGEREFLFHDTAPSRIIRHARHALSIDENREDFEPTLWDAKPGLDIRQVWFPGVHADVGGGYPERGLADCAAHWMLGEAQRFGLMFEDHLLGGLRPDPLAPQHNERKGIYRARRETVRRIDGPLHRSARQRWEADVQDYRRRSKALAALLATVGGDWSQIELLD